MRTLRKEFEQEAGVTRSDITEELRRIFKPRVFISIKEIAKYRGCSQNTAKTLMAGAHSFQFTPGSQKKSYHIKDVAARIARCLCIS